MIQWATVPLTHPLPPGMPTCRCPTGFTGPKCTQQVCAGYCANNSTCTVNQGNQPQCRCLPGFLGDRCQYRESDNPGPQGRGEESCGTCEPRVVDTGVSFRDRDHSQVSQAQVAGAPLWRCQYFPRGSEPSGIRII